LEERRNDETTEICLIKVSNSCMFSKRKFTIEINTSEKEWVVVERTVGIMDV